VKWTTISRLGVWLEPGTSGRKGNELVRHSIKEDKLTRGVVLVVNGAASVSQMILQERWRITGGRSPKKKRLKGGKGVLQYIFWREAGRRKEAFKDPYIAML